MHVEKIIIDVNNSMHNLIILIGILQWNVVVRRLVKFPLQKMKEIKFYRAHIK